MRFFQVKAGAKAYLPAAEKEALRSEAKRGGGRAYLATYHRKWRVKELT